jgi:response regulator of citrate/malate metabolism
MKAKTGVKAPATKKELPAVLIIEDNKFHNEAMVKAFKGKAHCIVCEDVPTAQKVLRSKEYDFAVIGLDACLGKKPNTRSLVREIRSLYACPVIAMSSETEYSAELVKNGATHTAEKERMPILAQKLIAENLQYALIPQKDLSAIKGEFQKMVNAFLNKSKKAKKFGDLFIDLQTILKYVHWEFAPEDVMAAVTGMDKVIEYALFDGEPSADMKKESVQNLSSCSWMK